MIILVRQLFIIDSNQVLRHVYSTLTGGFHRIQVATYEYPEWYRLSIVCFNCVENTPC